MTDGATRVVLRPLGADDAAAMFAYRSDPEVARFQSWEPRSVAELRSFIDELAAAQPYAAGRWHQLGIALRATGELIGDCGVHVPASEPRQAEFGITLATAWQGRGYATEALRALLAELFGTLGKHRVFGSVDPRNLRSVALLRRAGFREEAHLRENLWFKGEWADDVIFAMLRAEWAQRRASPGS